MGASRDMRVLSAAARALKRRNGRPALPALLFFTDPARTPDPIAAARRLPPGAAIIYRHFGAPDRMDLARRLLRFCRRRRLLLLIGADAVLASRIGADGVHLPERSRGLAPRLRRTHRHWLILIAAHHRLTGAPGADAAVLAPVFPTTSPSGRPPLGLRHANATARRALLPVYALGGVSAKTAARLSGFAGLAAVNALRSGTPTRA